MSPHLSPGVRLSQASYALPHGYAHVPPVAHSVRFVSILPYDESLCNIECLRISIV